MDKIGIFTFELALLDIIRMLIVFRLNSPHHRSTITYEIP